MTWHQAFEWLEATSIGVMVRESQWGFPILVAIHIMAITLSVGLLVWFDLRLLGVSMSGYRASMMYRRLTPWMFTGFAVMVMSGLMLLAGFATAAYGNFYFRIKMAAMIIAAVNAFIYHRQTERRIAQWDDTVPPRGARMAGLVSICVWAVVIMAGRMMSYTMF
jgi:uncharacterized membrane protein SirB2